MACCEGSYKHNEGYDQQVIKTSPYAVYIDTRSASICPTPEKFGEPGRKKKLFYVAPVRMQSSRKARNESWHRRAAQWNDQHHDIKVSRQDHRNAIPECHKSLTCESRRSQDPYGHGQHVDAGYGPRLPKLQELYLDCEMMSHHKVDRPVTKWPDHCAWPGDLAAYIYHRHEVFYGSQG